MIIKNGKRIDGCSDTVPIGVISPFLGLTPPNGYLVCQGQLISKTTYPELYAICGDSFGTATDTHFYLPDLRGKTITGYKEGDSTFGTLGGLIGALTHTHTTGNHTLTVDEIPGHKHLETIQTTDGNFNPVVQSRTGGSISYSIWPENATGGWTNTGSGDLMYTRETGGSQAHNHGDTGSSSSLQPSMNLNWIVKAAMLIPNYFVVENTLDSDSTQNALSAAQGKALNEKFNSYLPLNENRTITGMLTFNVENNGALWIENKNNNNESSIVFARDGYSRDENNKAYSFGYGTKAYDGVSLYSFETDNNVFAINSKGDMTVSGMILGTNLRGDPNFATWAALHVGLENEQYRLQLENNGHVYIYKTTDGGSSWSVYKELS